MTRQKSRFGRSLTGSRNVTGLVMLSVVRGAGCEATYGRNEKEHDQCDRSVVAQSACFPGDSSVVTGNNCFSPNGPCVEEGTKVERGPRGGLTEPRGCGRKN